MKMVRMDMSATNQSTQSSMVPRRQRLDLLTPPEVAIRAALHAVEILGPDVRLLEILTLLRRAQTQLADLVDERLT